MMHRLFTLLLFLATLLLTACFDNANTSRTYHEALTRNSISVHGNLPAGDTAVIIAKDGNNDGYVDDNEFTAPLFSAMFQNHYTVSDIQSKGLYAIRFEQEGFAPITYDLVAGSQKIDMSDFKPLYSATCNLKDIPDNAPITFDLVQNGSNFIAQRSDNSDTITPYFRLEIPRDAIPQTYQNISVVFDTQLDPRTQGYEVHEHVNYTLYDEQNNTIHLTKTPLETFGNLATEATYAFNRAATRSVLAARKVDISDHHSVCINATIVTDSEAKALDELQIDAYGPAHLRAVLGDGEMFEVYGDPANYNFSVQTRYVPNATQTFEVSTSSQAGCEYEASLTFNNPYTRALHVHADTNGSYSLQDGYVWIHNEDYSFYSYAYLDALGDATFYVAPNTAYSLHYKSTQIAVGADQNEAVFDYVDTPPLLYHYFTKESDDLFETLNVIALDDSAWLDINVTQKTLELQHNALEQKNDYHLWRFNVNATMVGNNIFGIKVQDEHNSVTSEAELYIPNYPPEILSVTLTDKYGDVFDLNDTLYDTDYNLTIVTAPDKNGHSIQAWGSFNPNSAYSDQNHFSLSSGTRTFYIKATDAYDTVTQTYNLNIEPYILSVGASNIANETLYFGDSKTYYFEASHPYDEALQYRWYINDTLVSTDANFTYTPTQISDVNISCSIFNHYKSYTKQASLHIVPKELILGSTNVYNNSADFNTTNTYYFSVTDPYGEALHYQWFIDDVLVSEDENLTYTFTQLGDHNFTCTVSNRYTTTSKKVKITVQYQQIVVTQSNVQSVRVYAGESQTYYATTTNPYHSSLYYQWYIDNVLVSEDETYTYDYNALGTHTIRAKISDGYTSVQISHNVFVEAKPIVIEDHNIFEEEVQLGTSRTYYLNATNPYSGALQYKWYVNDVLVSESEEFTYTFEQLGKFEVSCEVSNQYETITQSALIDANYEAPKIIDLSELPPELLYGNYTFYVVAEDMQDDNLTYEWLINGQVVSTDTNFTKSFNQDEELTLTCNVTNDYLTTTISRATRIYYPTPIITKGLENTQTSDATTFNVEAYHDLAYALTYEWLLDGSVVSNAETFEYTPQDALEHSLTCKVSNLYKSAETSATIGQSLTPQDLVIDTFPGNHVVIYDDDMNVTHDFIADESGTVRYSTSKSHVNFAVILDRNATISKEMVFKFTVGKYWDADICDFYAGKMLADRYPSADSNSDGYVDADEIYSARVDGLDTNGNGKIEMGEIPESHSEGEIFLVNPLDVQINMHYPVTRYTYKDKAFMHVMDAYIHSGNMRFFNQSEYEKLKCGLEQSYVDITVTGMPSELTSTSNFVYLVPEFMNFDALNLPENEIIDSVHGADDYNVTYRTYAFSKQDNGLIDFGLILDNSSMYYVTDINTTTTTNLTVSYDELKTMTQASGWLSAPHSNIYSTLIHDGQSTRSNYAEYTLDASNNFLLADNTLMGGLNFDYLYNLDSGFSLAQQTSFETVANSTWFFQDDYTLSEATSLLNLKPFYVKNYAQLYYVDEDNIENVDFVTYQYQLTNDTTVYASIQVNYPNEYFDAGRFIGFTKLDNNETFSSLLPASLKEKANAFFSITDTAANRPYFNEKLQLLDFKDYTPSDRDALIQVLENQTIETMQRKESTFYNYDGEYYTGY